MKRGFSAYRSFSAIMGDSIQVGFWAVPGTSAIVDSSAAIGYLAFMGSPTNGGSHGVFEFMY